MFSSNVTSDPAACQFCVSFSTINKEQNVFYANALIKILQGDTSKELMTWYD